MSGEEPLERLRTAVDRLPADDVAELVAEARAEARARVRSMLSDALTESLLAQTRAELERRGESTAAPDTEDPQPRRPPDTRARPLENPAWYVYGVIDAREEAVVMGLRGIADQPVEIVTEGQVAGVYSQVPSEEFDESELRAHLADMAWVENVARGHEAVLDDLCRRTTVIPMRMCTVYQTEARVREMLSREQTPLQEAIEYLEGKHEWGVQAFFHRDRALRPTHGEELDAPGGPTGAAGAAYMQSRRRERDSDEQLEQRVNEAAEEIHDSLEAITADSAINPPQRPEATGRNGAMVLNGVYLVEDSAKETFDEQVRELQSAFSSTGLELLITGPWPPYNFLPGSIGAAW